MTDMLRAGRFATLGTIGVAGGAISLLGAGFGAAVGGGVGGVRDQVAKHHTSRDSVSRRKSGDTSSQSLANYSASYAGIAALAGLSVPAVATAVVVYKANKSMKTAAQSAEQKGSPQVRALRNLRKSLAEAWAVEDDGETTTRGRSRDHSPSSYGYDSDSDSTSRRTASVFSASQRSESPHLELPR